MAASLVYLFPSGFQTRRVSLKNTRTAGPSVSLAALNNKVVGDHVFFITKQKIMQGCRRLGVVSPVTEGGLGA